MKHMEIKDLTKGDKIEIVGGFPNLFRPLHKNIIYEVVEVKQYFSSKWFIVDLQDGNRQIFVLYFTEEYKDLIEIIEMAE